MKLYFEYEKNSKTIAVTHISREEDLTIKDIESFIMSVKTLILPEIKITEKDQSKRKCSVCGLYVDRMNEAVCYDKKCPLKSTT